MVFVFFLAAAIASATETQWRRELLDGSNHNKYRTYKEYDDILEAMLKKYPKLLRKEKVGESLQKRPLHVYHLMDQDSTLQKDQVFINSLIHAREAQTVLTLMDYLARTLEAIEKGDPHALYVIKRRHIVFMPFINIDSYIANEKSDTHLIRKNQRDVCPEGGEGQNGVDLNRNFPVGWKDAPDNKCSQTYRGSAPFSEPETQAVKGVVEKHAFKVAYNIHSFGPMLVRVGSNIAILPENHVKVFDELQQVIKAERYGTGWELFKDHAPGNVDDWLYKDHGIFSMTPELGTAFWQEHHEKADLLEKEWPRTRYVVYKAGCEPRVHVAKSGEEFSVANDGVSDCPPLKLAFSGSSGDPVVVDVGTIPARESKKTPGKTGDVKKVCVKEEGLDVCICNPTSPGEGTWENNTNALCAALVTADSTTSPPSSSSPHPPSSSSPSSSSPPSSSAPPSDSSSAPASDSSSASSPDSSSDSSTAPSSNSSSAPLDSDDDSDADSEPSSPSGSSSSKEDSISTMLMVIIIASATVAALALLALFALLCNERGDKNSQLSGLRPLPHDDKNQIPGQELSSLEEKQRRGRKKAKSAPQE